MEKRPRLFTCVSPEPTDLRSSYSHTDVNVVPVDNLLVFNNCTEHVTVTILSLSTTRRTLCTCIDYWLVLKSKGCGTDKGGHESQLHTMLLLELLLVLVTHGYYITGGGGEGGRGGGGEGREGGKEGRRGRGGTVG